MEFLLRCNDLKCRAQLHDQAIVTTCSHVFCARCADASGLSRAAGAARQCPACNAQLPNPDDVVVAQLNPTEDYKTSVLSGLSPNIIMECASRGLAFYSYQASQEIIYQECLAKSLTDKYSSLSQQMDQLIHEANSQIKALQDKLQAMQIEQQNLEQKNHELVDAFREKSRTQQQVQKLYQSLKAQVMASHVATAATDEVEHSLHTARGNRYVDKIPGTRTGTANLSAYSGNIQGNGRRHARGDSGSSGGDGQRKASQNIGIGPTWNSQAWNTRNYSSQSVPVQSDTPSQHRSRLPVLGGQRGNNFLGGEIGGQYQPSPITRQPLGAKPFSTGLGNFGYTAGGRSTKRSSGGPLGR